MPPPPAPPAVEHGHTHGLVDASIKRSREGRLDSAALIADGNHARVDGLVSLGVVVSAAVVAIGLETADPVIGLAIAVVILRITWQSFQTVRGHHHHHDPAGEGG